MQTTRHIAGLTVLAVCVAAGAISASDRTAVYARIDKVVLEPTAESPQRAQVWGVFAMAKPNDMNDYLPPARGYLYSRSQRTRRRRRKSGPTCNRSPAPIRSWGSAADGS